MESRGILIRSPSLRGVAEEAFGAYRDAGEVVLATERAGLAGTPRGARYNRWPMAEDVPAPDIVLVSERIACSELRRLVDRFFEDMVKYVVDVERGVAAVGGELHADEEALLLEDGSRQDDLWGANYYPGRGEERCIEYTSLINIRPAQGNRSMLIEDEARRARVRELTFALLGRGEPLA